MYGSCSEGLAGALRKTAKETLEAYTKRMNNELAEQGGKEQVVAEEKKAVCIRCRRGIAFPCGRIAAEETINSMRDGEGPGLLISFGWTCGGCGGDEGKTKEAVNLQPGFFSRFSSPDEMMCAAEEMTKTEAEKVDTEVALAKTGGEEEEGKIDVVKFVKETNLA